MTNKTQHLNTSLKPEACPSCHIEQHWWEHSPTPSDCQPEETHHLACASRKHPQVTTALPLHLLYHSACHKNAHTQSHIGTSNIATRVAVVITSGEHGNANCWLSQSTNHPTVSPCYIHTKSPVSCHAGPVAYQTCQPTMLHKQIQIPSRKSNGPTRYSRYYPYMSRVQQAVMQHPIQMSPIDNSHHTLFT